MKASQPKSSRNPAQAKAEIQPKSSRSQGESLGEAQTQARSQTRAGARGEGASLPAEGRPESDLAGSGGPLLGAARSSPAISAAISKTRAGSRVRVFLEEFLRNNY